MNAMAISIRQPWASYIALGPRTIEHRSWSWGYRGPLVICASKSGASGLAFDGRPFPTGCALAIVDMIDCRPIKKADMPAAYGPRELWPEVAGYAFVLANARQVRPVAVKGQLRPWKWAGPALVEVPDHLEEYWKGLRM